MTTITIDKRMLEKLYLYWLEDADPHELEDFEEQVRTTLSAPATAPAWNNVPTCEGLWLCDEGDENPYRFTCHDISMPLNPHLVGEGERWYGPIPENTQ